MVQSRLLDMPTIAFQHDVAEKLPIHGDVRQLIRLHSNDHLQVRRAGIIPVDAFCLLGDGLPAVPDCWIRSSLVMVTFTHSFQRIKKAPCGGAGCFANFTAE